MVNVSKADGSLAFERNSSTTFGQSVADASLGCLCHRQFRRTGPQGRARGVSFVPAWTSTEE